MQSIHESSVLLNIEDNRVIHSLLSRGESALSTAVIQLVVSRPPEHNQWDLFSTGVMCFIKSNKKRTYFFRLYDFDEKRMVWEQEIYLNINYMKIESYFHTLEAEECMVGLSFADIRDANNFLNAVQQKSKLLLKMFIQTENSVKTETNVRKSEHFLEVPKDMSSLRTHSLESLTKRKSFSFKIKTLKKSKTKILKINKLSISSPTNFRHIQHIGWNPSTGFDFNLIDPKLDNFFRMAGVSAEQLDDIDTRKFIFDFIDTHGGLEAAINETPKPLQTKEIKTAIIDGNEKSTTTVNLSCSSLPPPPPPPPLPPTPPPPPPLPMDLSLNSSQITKNPIQSSNSNNNEKPIEMDCSRNELLEQIRSGISLKKRENITNESQSSMTTNSGNPLAHALSQALQNRFRVNQMTDCLSEDSDTNCEETEFNEWSD